jgi:hypothetical protein
VSTRRGFIGLFAAAPVVAPEVIKQIGAEMIKPKSANLGFTFKVDSFKIAAGSITSHSGVIGGFTVRDFESCELSTLAFAEPKRCTQCGSCGMERYCSRPTCGMIVPNRLYGATINQQGEAI